MTKIKLIVTGPEEAYDNEARIDFQPPQAARGPAYRGAVDAQGILSAVDDAKDIGEYHVYLRVERIDVEERHEIPVS